MLLAEVGSVLSRRHSPSGLVLSHRCDSTSPRFQLPDTPLEWNNDVSWGLHILVQQCKELHMYYIDTILGIQPMPVMYQYWPVQHIRLSGQNSPLQLITTLSDLAECSH